MDSDKYYYEIKQPWSTNKFMGLKSISRVCGRIEQRAQGIAALMEAIMIKISRSAVEQHMSCRRCFLLAYNIIGLSACRSH